MKQAWQKPNLTELSAAQAGITITDQASLFIAKNQIHIVVSDRTAFDAIPAEAQEGKGVVSKSGEWGSNQVIFQHRVPEEQSAA